MELVVTIFHLINFIISYFAEFVNSFENIKVLGFRKAQYNDGEYLHCTGYKSNDEYKYEINLKNAFVKIIEK